MVHFTMALLFFPITFANSENVTQLSISICEIIENFYSKYSKNVDVIDFGGLQGDLVGKIMENHNNSITVTLTTTKNPQNWSKRLQSQSILLFNNFTNFANFNEKNLEKIQFINRVRFTIYCQNMTEWDLTTIDSSLSTVSYCYFIIFNKIENKLKLYTFENSNETRTHCHNTQQLIQSNEFDAKSQKWKIQPIILQKYSNFYGCNMFIGISNPSSYLKFQIVSGIMTSTGPLNDLMDEIAIKLNFSLYYVLCRKAGCVDPMDRYGPINNVLAISAYDSSIASENVNFVWRKVLIGIQFR